MKTIQFTCTTNFAQVDKKHCFRKLSQVQEIPFKSDMCLHQESICERRIILNRRHLRCALLYHNPDTAYIIHTHHLHTPQILRVVNTLCTTGILHMRNILNTHEEKHTTCSAHSWKTKMRTHLMKD